MTDDVFKLGNFEGLEDGAMAPLDLTPSQSPPISASSGTGGGVIRHPTVQSDPQAKFRSPRADLRFLELDLDKIVPNEFQPRRIFNEEKLQELAASIKENGII